MRLLSVYQRIAHRTHWCDNCLKDIEIGEFYEGSVFLRPERRRGRIFVLRRHLEPLCETPPPEKFEDDMSLDQDQDFAEAA